MCILQKKLPLVSIICVVYNGEKHIKRAIESVLNQNYENIELVIIDGDSSDQTIAIINSFNDKRVKIISEKDRGIYDAMNKGIDLSSGEWLFFLGSDDYLFSDFTLENMMTIAIEDSSIDLIYGDVCTDKNKKITSKISKKMLLHNTLHHQSALYKRKNFCSFRYDPELKIIADYELNLVLYLNKTKVKYVKEMIAVCQGGGESTKHINWDLFIKETNIVRGKQVPLHINILLSIIFNLKCFIHKLIKSDR